MSFRNGGPARPEARLLGPGNDRGVDRNVAQ